MFLRHFIRPFILAGMMIFPYLFSGLSCSDPANDSSTIKWGEALRNQEFLDPITLEAIDIEKDTLVWLKAEVSNPTEAAKNFLFLNDSFWRPFSVISLAELIAKNPMDPFQRTPLTYETPVLITMGEEHPIEQGRFRFIRGGNKQRVYFGRISPEGDGFAFFHRIGSKTIYRGPIAKWNPYGEGDYLFPYHPGYYQKQYISNVGRDLKILQHFPDQARIEIEIKNGLDPDIVLMTTSSGNVVEIPICDYQRYTSFEIISVN